MNSLYAHGFRGNIWAGYRGALPPWAKPLAETAGYTEFQVADGCALRFVHLETTAHLTNFKPDFMLSVLEKHDPACEALFYIDPDVVVCERWNYFMEWVSCGVAVCEDPGSPYPLHHPRRIGWRRGFEPFGFTLKPRESCYANGGFVGVARVNQDFLLTWKRLQDAMWTIIGGAEFAGIPGGQAIGDRGGFFDCFEKTDQDALNAAIEAAPEISVSFLGRHAMGFESGKAFLPHSVGALKPWRNRIITNALRGYGCPVPDRHFWEFVEMPIRLYPSRVVRWRRMQLRVAAAIGRFYRRQ
ncbi:MAG: hypothetical protein WCK55_06820 [Verrucomicrobiota bacterium]